MAASSLTGRRPRFRTTPPLSRLILAAPWTTTMLVLERVAAAYDDVVCLSGVALEVGRGEFVALIGAKGAGKTTTLKTVSVLLAATAGRITFDGRNITGLMPDTIVAAGLVQVPEGRR